MPWEDRVEREHVQRHVIRDAQNQGGSAGRHMGPEVYAGSQEEKPSHKEPEREAEELGLPHGASGTPKRALGSMGLFLVHSRKT